MHVSQLLTHWWWWCSHMRTVVPQHPVLTGTPASMRRLGFMMVVSWCSRSGACSKSSGADCRITSSNWSAAAPGTPYHVFGSPLQARHGKLHTTTTTTSSATVKHHNGVKRIIHICIGHCVASHWHPQQLHLSNHNRLGRVGGGCPLKNFKIHLVTYAYEILLGNNSTKRAAHQTYDIFNAGKHMTVIYTENIS